MGDSCFPYSCAYYNKIPDLKDILHTDAAIRIFKYNKSPLEATEQFPTINPLSSPSAPPQATGIHFVSSTEMRANRPMSDCAEV